MQIDIADLRSSRCVLLSQPAHQRHAASFCAAEEHNTADSVEVVEVGTRGRARRAQTATRCPTWVRGACWCSGSPAARWTGNHIISYAKGGLPHTVVRRPRDPGARTSEVGGRAPAYTSARHADEDAARRSGTADAVTRRPPGGARRSTAPIPRPVVVLAASDLATSGVGSRGA